LIDLKISGAELSKHKLFIGTPQYGGQCVGMFSRSIADLSALCTHYGIALQLFYLFNESLITRARNYICDEFMRSEAEHLMFIDADIGFDAKDVIALMALQMQSPEYDIIGGCYPKKCISWEKVKQAVDRGLADKDANILERFVGDFVFNPKAGTSQIPLGQPVEVLEIGTGFMMIRKETMRKFLAAFPEYHYRPDHIRTQHFDGSREILQYFQAEIDQLDYRKAYSALIEKIKSKGLAPEAINAELKSIDDEAKKYSKRYLSEDYWFSQKCQGIGLKTWLCPWMKLSHMGSYVFSGSLMDLAQSGSAATADASILKKAS